MPNHVLPRLGVNIDHVATLRQVRGTPYPNLLEAAALAVQGGAKQITVHLREDRRHIQDDDVVQLRKSLPRGVELNLEMAVTPEMLRFARKVRPHWVCLVPEKRQELTTEGGLNVKSQKARVAKAIKDLQSARIRVSPFIEADLKTVELCHTLGADAVEIHTGAYADAKTAKARTTEYRRVVEACRRARALGLRAHAGHGLTDANVRGLALERHSDGTLLIQEYNIGHSIVARSVMVGMERAVREMGAALWAP